jgi:hypothetical protein
MCIIMYFLIINHVRVILSIVLVLLPKTQCIVSFDFVCLIIDRIKDVFVLFFFFSK